MSSNVSFEAYGSVAEEKESSPSFANKMGRIVFLALEDVADSESMRAILSAARMQDRLDHYPPNNFAAEFSFVELRSIQVAIEELYGPRTGRRLARRIGRACFRRGVEDLRPVLGIADLVLRILPLRMRFRLGFEVLAQMFDRFSDQVVDLEEDERYFSWVMERCGVCWGRHTAAPCCDLMVGLLEEGLYWLSGGERFFIEESSCIASGDPTCTILIGKDPLADDTTVGD
jgi:predicted hydrocarbon binding protein